MFTKKRRRNVYCDFAAATPVSSKALHAMQPYFAGAFYNPSSIHVGGVVVKQALEQARSAAARIAGVRSQEVLFTAGGTESLNLAIMGLVRAQQQEQATVHVVTSTIEHPAVLEPIAQLEREGCQVTYVQPNELGLITAEAVADALQDNTVLVSIGYVNGEIGTIMPLGDIARAIKQHKEKLGRDSTSYPYFHTDAAQAPNYLSVQLEKLGVDMLSIDAAKFYGPKGCGILYKRHYVPMRAVLHGGSQEAGLRPGTENLPLIVGCVTALEEVNQTRDVEAERLRALQGYFINAIQKEFADAIINGTTKEQLRIPNNVNICFPGTNSEFLVLQLDVHGIAVSAMTACKNLDDTAYSYVVDAVGGQQCAGSSIRFTFGRSTTKKDIDYILVVLKKVLQNK